MVYKIISRAKKQYFKLKYWLWFIISYKQLEKHFLNKINDELDILYSANPANHETLLPFYSKVDSLIHPVLVKEAKATGIDKMPCAGKCSYCCKNYRIEVTANEVNAILDYVLNVMPEKESCLIINQIFDSFPMSNEQNRLINKNPTCALLLNGSCSVYHLRPLTCRIYNSRSVKACESYANNGKHLPIIFVSPKIAEQIYAEGVNRSNGLFLTYEINDALKTAIKTLQQSILSPPNPT